MSVPQPQINDYCEYDYTNLSTMDKQMLCALRDVIYEARKALDKSIEINEKLKPQKFFGGLFNGFNRKFGA